MMLKKLFKSTYQSFRKIKYRLLSDNTNIHGNPRVLQPAIYSGQGQIYFKSQVTLGYNPSPFFYSGTIYIEARRKESKVLFGNQVFANNNLTIICEGSSIEVGNNVLIGTNVEILDSDFHEIHPERRNSGKHICKPVKIEDNVFIGSNVKILKGVTIGENSIVANGSVVTSSCSKNVIIAGNPAKVIRTIEI